MLKRQINLQLFADLDEIVENNKDAFEGVDIKTNFETIQTKLSELGYDVLINHKEKAEFVPSSRLSEVVQQRDTFKAKIEKLNEQLETLKGQAGNSAELNTKLQTIMGENEKLLEELEKSKITTAIMVAAKDAYNSKAVLPFVNMENIKVTKKGEILGIDEEIDRIKEEMPFLFVDGTTKKKAGLDNLGGKDEPQAINMNAMIRKAAGRTF